MTQNKRNYFRLDVTAPLAYRVLPMNVEPSALVATADSAFVKDFFVDHLKKLDEEIHEVLEQIGVKSQLLAKALTAINRKMDFLLDTIDEKNLIQTLPMVTFNLSGGGIAFTMNQPAEMGQLIEVIMLLDETGNPLILRGRVVKTRPKDDSGYWVSIEFTDISEDDRRLLIFFIQTREIQAHYAQKGQAPNPASQ